MLFMNHGTTLAARSFCWSETAFIMASSAALGAVLMALIESLALELVTLRRYIFSLKKLD